MGIPYVECDSVRFSKFNNPFIHSFVFTPSIWSNYLSLAYLIISYCSLQVQVFVFIISFPQFIFLYLVFFFVLSFALLIDPIPVPFDGFPLISTNSQYSYLDFDDGIIRLRGV